MAIAAVIFDIGGVLEYTPPTGWEQRWALRLGLEPADLHARMDPIWSGGDVGELSLDEVERRTAHTLALDPPALRSLMEDIWREYVGSLNEELARYFAALRPRYRTGILSNSFVGAREREQDLYGFEDMCDAVVYSHEEGVKKPEARAYEIVCRRLGVAPVQALFLDDVEANVQGAQRVGMTAIRFLDNEQAIAELELCLGAGGP